MIYKTEVNGAITQLNCAIRRLKGHGDRYAIAHLHNVKSTLKDVVSNMNTLYGKVSVAESSRDALLMAIAGTTEGRNLDITSPNDALNQAMTIVRTMDADLRTNREAEEIPFGAVEQDHDKMQLQQRVAELELQLELKVDECIATDNHLREFKAQWLSLINFINSISPESLRLPKYLAAIDPAMPNSETTIFSRRYSSEGVNIGWFNFRIKTESMSHELKILPEFFKAVISGHKKAEIRKNDRFFSIGDELWFREWTTQDGYTGRHIYRVITHITDLSGYAPGYVMLSIEPECKGAQ